MRSEECIPELSVIVPTLNEAEALPGLLADLAGQQGVDFEVIVSDGGSRDATCQAAADALDRHRLAGRILQGTAGRGRQLNRGGIAARGERLLFLHADSRLPDPHALGESLALLRGKQNPRLGGRFALRFDAPDRRPDFGCYLCEVKARLDLPGTIHGDQGFLLMKEFWRELGGFREDLPVLEDTLLAEEVRRRGGWLRLPAKIVTSSRRFRAEGYAARQMLNALLMNFAMIGWDEPLKRFPEFYRSQDATQALELAPIFRELTKCLAALPPGERRRLWYLTGGHVRANAWQLSLRRLARRAFVAGLPADSVPLEPVLRFRRRFDAVADNPPGKLAAAVGAWFWFRRRCRQFAQGE